MKTKIFFSIALVMLLFINGSSLKALSNSVYESKDSITIQCEPELYNLAVSWVTGFCKDNPTAKILILKPFVESKGVNNASRLKLVSGGLTSVFDKGSEWRMIVGSDAIVPIISAKSFNAKLSETGITIDKMKELVIRSQSNIHANSSQKVYLLKSESFKLGLSEFFKNEINITKEFENADELISQVSNDPNAIGFCLMSNIIDPNTHDFVTGIKPLPIDVNGNGKLDYAEDIYKSGESFIHGVWIGKYSKELYQNISFIASSKPTNDEEVAFIAWTVSKGQQYLSSNGYCDLTNGQKQANLDRLFYKPTLSFVSGKSYAIPVAIAIILIVIVGYFSIDYAFSRLKAKRLDWGIANKESAYFNENSISVLDGLYFDKSHTWVFMEKEGNVSVGLDDFIQHVTGPLTRIKMKQTGDKIKKGEPFLTLIQDGKQLNIKAPISGIIKECNRKLESNISMLSQFPYGEGWVYVIEPANWQTETQFLIMSQGYREWLRMEFLHLKDFLAIVLKESLFENKVVLQDGGEIKSGILKDMKPETWEDFQSHFLDGSK